LGGGAAGLDGGAAVDLTPFENVQADILLGEEGLRGRILITLNKDEASRRDIYRLDLETGALELAERDAGKFQDWIADHGMKLRGAVQARPFWNTNLVAQMFLFSALSTGTATILIANFLFRYIPVGIQSGVAGLRQIDPAIEEAATNLGASTQTTFWRITLPLLVPAFFSGLVFSFVRAMTAISAAIFLVSADWSLMTVQILSQTEAGRLGAAAAFSVILILIILLAIALIRLILGQLLEYHYEATFG
jgi:hypothetical protein